MGIREPTRNDASSQMAPELASRFHSAESMDWPTRVTTPTATPTPMVSATCAPSRSQPESIHVQPMMAVCADNLRRAIGYWAPDA